jgi:hypothetical protein
MAETLPSAVLFALVSPELGAVSRSGGARKAESTGECLAWPVAVHGGQPDVYDAKPLGPLVLANRQSVTDLPAHGDGPSGNGSDCGWFR